jgi:cytochrome c-type biogenesis protein CcsB
MAVDEGLAQLSDHLLGGTMAVYATAMLGYAAEFAFNRFGRAPARAATPSPVAVGVAAAAERNPALVGASTLAPGRSAEPEPIADPAATALAAAEARRAEDSARRAEASANLAAAGGWEGGDPPAPGRAQWAGRLAVALTLVGWALHIGSVATRGLAAGRVPWGNMYEFSSMICLIAVTTFLALLVRQSVRWLGVFVMLPVVLYLGYAGTKLYVAAGPLVPALNSYWLKIHVMAAIVSSGVFLVSAVVTVLYLVKDRWENRLAEVAAGRAEASTAMRRRGGIVMRLPSSAALDTLTYRVIAFAFPIWTFAIIAGAIWAEAAWGRYWGWDPKETWSFITWVIYAAYLHARATGGWRGRRAAAVSLLGFSALFVDYYLVNLVISGLHSYAGVK